MMNNCIGLFGTCGGSKWRDAFIESYFQHGITFFNPQVEDWDPSFALVEAEHLANDNIMAWPITSETLGLGSISEIGFSLIQAMNLESRRDFVVMVDQFVDDAVKEEFGEVMVKESLRGRALILQHIKKVNLANVYLVDNLQDMLKVTLRLREISVIRQKIEEIAVSP
jgi:hypothetical protein